jgi:hypothetical protein
MWWYQWKSWSQLVLWRGGGSYGSLCRELMWQRPLNTGQQHLAAKAAAQRKVSAMLRAHCLLLVAPGVQSDHLPQPGGLPGAAGCGHRAI